MNALPMTADVRRDLWIYFGETWIDAARMAGSAPSLPATSVKPGGREGPPVLDLNTPFGAAFATWRAQKTP